MSIVALILLHRKLKISNWNFLNFLKSINIGDKQWTSTFTFLKESYILGCLRVKLAFALFFLSYLVVILLLVIQQFIQQHHQWAQTMYNDLYFLNQHHKTSHTSTSPCSASSIPWCSSSTSLRPSTCTSHQCSSSTSLRPSTYTSHQCIRLTVRFWCHT